ncbi:F-box protein-like protein, partial [Tanacetum coccineum]
MNEDEEEEDRITYDIQFESQVNNCIRYAVNRNVQDLSLTLWTRSEFELRHGFFFTNSCFTNLSVLRCKFIPSGTISWNKLTTLRIAYANINEDLIENIFSESPLLEALILNNCYGFKRIDITSKSVKNFLFYGYVTGRDEDDIIKINAPYIVSLAIQDDMPEVEMFKGLLLSLRHVKELEIGIACSKVFSCLEAKGFVFPSNLKVGDWYEYDSDSDETGDLEELLLDDGHESEDWSFDPSLPWKDIAWLSITKLPFLMKGVLTREDGKQWREKQIRKISDKVFDYYKNEAGTANLGFEDLYIASVLFGYSDINKRLPGPHFDPPKKEEIRALMK